MENIKQIKLKLEEYVLDVDLINSIAIEALPVSDAIELILKLDKAIANHQAYQGELVEKERSYGYAPEISIKGNKEEVEKIVTILEKLLKIQFYDALSQGQDVSQILDKDLAEIHAEVSERLNRCYLPRKKE